MSLSDVGSRLFFSYLPSFLFTTSYWCSMHLLNYHNHTNKCQEPQQEIDKTGHLPINYLLNDPSFKLVISSGHADDVHRYLFTPSSHFLFKQLQRIVFLITNPEIFLSLSSPCAPCSVRAAFSIVMGGQIFQCCVSHQNTLIHKVATADIANTSSVVFLSSI